MRSTTLSAGLHARRTLEQLYAAAIRAVDPVAAVRGAVMRERPVGRVAIIATGKASVNMARGALEALEMMGTACAGGIVVTDAAPQNAVLPLPVVLGDHPLPAEGSYRAARTLGGTVERIDAPEVWVLLSGGTSSLIGAPIEGISRDSLEEVFRLAAGAGLDIATTNALRRRLLRWGGGRLARALSPRRVCVFAISDVPGDDPRVIGSGPCAKEALGYEELGELLDKAGIRNALPPDVRAYLAECERAGSTADGQDPEPPHAVVLRNADALDGAAAEARRLGFDVGPRRTLSGEARQAGVMAGSALRTAPRGCCLLWGGETTVTLGADPGAGGRAQELALAAAPLLAGTGAVLLSAGTDGRDGPTDAAGAVVDGGTVEALRARGMSHEAALARHDSFPALDAVGALLRTGPTGTNVMDVVIGIVPR
jgi:hydroxypyruvate reductase